MTLHRILSRARLLLALLSFTALAGGDPARADDSVPTEWQRLSRVEPLLTAPEPDNPVAVCVIDSGVNLTPDLEPVVISRTAYDGGDPGDTYPQPNGMTGHGTYVASFIAGQVNGWGSSGTWPRARIVSVRVFPPGGEVADLADVIWALRACVQQPMVRVINLSLGALDATEPEWSELENRITSLRNDRDINIVAAAGNAGGPVERPARFAASFAVGAAAADGTACGYSARGAELDILVTGCGMASATEAGDAATFAGTSFGAPVVAASLAAVRAYASVDAANAERLVTEAARRSESGPLLDVAAALELAGRDDLVQAHQQPSPSGRGLPASAPASERMALPAPRYRVVRRGAATP